MLAGRKWYAYHCRTMYSLTTTDRYLKFNFYLRNKIKLSRLRKRNKVWLYVENKGEVESLKTIESLVFTNSKSNGKSSKRRQIALSYDRKKLKFYFLCQKFFFLEITLLTFTLRSPDGFLSRASKSFCRVGRKSRFREVQS